MLTKKQLQNVAVLAAILLAAAIGLAVGRGDYYHVAVPGKSRGGTQNILSSSLDTSVRGSGGGVGIIGSAHDTSLRGNGHSQNIISNSLDTSFQGGNGQGTNIIGSTLDTSLQGGLSAEDEYLLSCLNQANPEHYNNCFTTYKQMLRADQ